MCNREKKSKNPKFFYPSIKKNIEKSLLFFSWETAGRIEAMFSLNKRAKRAENKSLIIFKKNYSDILREIKSYMFRICKPFQNDIYLDSLTSLTRESKCCSNSINVGVLKICLHLGL